MRFRVLISCRDSGAAGQIIPVIRGFLGDDRFDVKVVAHGPALGLISSAGLPVTPFREGNGFGSGDSSSLRAAASKLLEEWRPDAVVAGVSSMGIGVDEALLAVAKVPTFAMQDLWGEINLGLGVPAGTYFVLDENALELTQAVVKANVVVVGSAKHRAYSDLDIYQIRAVARNEVGEGKAPIVGFFGQCADLPGHEENFNDFLDAVGKLSFSIRLVLREHPKTSPQVANAHLKQARSCCPNVVDATSRLSAEHWLAACDLVVTPFSTCGIDHAYLTAYSSIPLGNVLYVMTNKLLREERTRQVSSYRFPTIDLGLGSIVESIEDIGPEMKRLLGQPELESYYERAKGLSRSNAVEAVVNEVISQLQRAPF